MNISDLTYAMDKLNLYRAGQLGQLQSPQAMELYRQMYGAATSKPVQQGSKQLIQKSSLGALGKTGANILGKLATPNIGLGVNNLLLTYGLVDENRKRVDNRLQEKYPIPNQAAFDYIYPMLTTQERGQLGYTYPEYYQNYMGRQ